MPSYRVRFRSIVTKDVVVSAPDRATAADAEAYVLAEDTPGGDYEWYDSEVIGETDAEADFSVGLDEEGDE